MGVAKYVLGLPAVLVCMVATAIMAWRFGLTIGATDLDRHIYAAAGISVDILKGLLPIFMAIAWRAGRRGYCIAAGTAFAVFVTYSLAASFGLAAIQHAGKNAEHAAVATAYTDRRAELGRLLAQRDAMPAVAPVSADAIKVAQDAVHQIDEARAAECSKRGPLCRKHEETLEKKQVELSKLTAGADATRIAAELDGKISAARTKLEGIDLKAVNADVDAQAVALVKLVGQFVGDDHAKVRTLIHALLAIVLEFGSGLGLFLVFGSHAPAADVKEERQLDVVRPVIFGRIEGDPVEFLTAALVPGAGTTVHQVTLAYEDWCRERNRDPMPRPRFKEAFAALCDRSGFRRVRGKVFGMALKTSMPQLAAAE